MREEKEQRKINYTATDHEDETQSQGGIMGVIERKLSRKLTKKLIIIAMIGILCVAGVLSFRFAYRITNGESVDEAPGREVSVYIHDSMSVRDVSNMLYEKGLIVNTLDFDIQAMMKGYKPSKYAGSYILNTCLNAEKQVNELMNLTEKDK